MGSFALLSVSAPARNRSRASRRLLKQFSRHAGTKEGVLDWVEEDQERSCTVTSLSKALVSAVMGAGLLAFSGLAASAAVVCTGNTCWHATEKYDYPPDARVTIHEDTWKPGPSITFREHTGRGYWAGETWKEW
jgi:hypothetical protein